MWPSKSHHISIEALRQSYHSYTKLQSTLVEKHFAHSYKSVRTIAASTAFPTILTPIFAIDKVNDGTEQCEI